jgi:hypothetical protein
MPTTSDASPSRTATVTSIKLPPTRPSSLLEVHSTFLSRNFPESFLVSMGRSSTIAWSHTQSQLYDFDELFVTFAHLSLLLQAVLMADLPFILKLPTILKILSKEHVCDRVTVASTIAAGRLVSVGARQPERFHCRPIMVLEADRFSTELLPPTTSYHRPMNNRSALRFARHRRTPLPRHIRAKRW